MKLFPSILRNAIGLGLFALVTAGAITITQNLTTERIEQNIKQAQARALNELIPQGTYDNNLINDFVPVSDFDTKLLGPIKKTDVIYLAREHGKITTLLMPVAAPDGYTQEIRLSLAIYANGTIAGVRTTEHRETPGLGDKIDLNKDGWILGFNGKSLTNPPIEDWTVKKDGGDFDQFTGATITPRAVVIAIKNALLFYKQHEERLLSIPEPLSEIEE